MLRVACLCIALATLAFAPPPPDDAPTKFAIQILVRDFEGCQYRLNRPLTTRCSDWASVLPGPVACVAGINPDFEGQIAKAGERGISLPRHVFNAVLPTLGADKTPIFNENLNDPFYSTKENFYEWYHDVPGKNVREYSEATFEWGLDPLGSGFYAYVWDMGWNAGPYFPVDGRGFGNYCSYGPHPPSDPPKPYGVTASRDFADGRAECYWRIDGEVGTAGQCPERRYPAYQHNFHFTDLLEWDFQYDASQPNQFIEYNGDDDTWVFIGDIRVIDLGGVDWVTNLMFRVDYNEERLGLVDGEIYTVRWFHAQRKVECSHHILVTTLFPICRVDNEDLPCGKRPDDYCSTRVCKLNRCVVTLDPETAGKSCPPPEGSPPAGPCEDYICVADPEKGGGKCVAHNITEGCVPPVTTSTTEVSSTSTSTSISTSTSSTPTTSTSTSSTPTTSTSTSTTTRATSTSTSTPTTSTPTTSTPTVSTSTSSTTRVTTTSTTLPPIVSSTTSIPTTSTPTTSTPTTSTPTASTSTTSTTSTSTTTGSTSTSSSTTLPPIVVTTTSTTGAAPSTTTSMSSTTGNITTNTTGFNTTVPSTPPGKKKDGLGTGGIVGIAAASSAVVLAAAGLAAYLIVRRSSSVPAADFSSLGSPSAANNPIFTPNVNQGNNPLYAMSE